MMALAACGTPDTFTAQLSYQDGAMCLSCTAQIPEQPHLESMARPRVWAAPGMLMFYTSDGTEFEPKEVVVHNDTDMLVLITRATIVDDPAEPGGAGGAIYFATDAVAEPIPLEARDAVTVWVTFLGSSRQRSALLNVYTTDPTFHTLSVKLTGKYFSDG